jgi:hypothetical protein
MRVIRFGIFLIVTVSAYLAVGPALSSSQVTPKSSGEAVIDLLAQGNFDAVASRVNPEFTGSLSAAKMREGWASVVANHGPFRRRTGTQVGKGPGGYDVVIVMCEFEKSSVPARVIFDGQMKIVGLWIRPQPPPSPPPPLPASNQDDAIAVAAKAKAKEAVDIIVSEDIPRLRNRFSEQLQVQLSEQRIREIWAIVVLDVGAFRKQVSSQYARVDQQDVVAVRCEFERGFAQIRVTFDQQNKIVGLYFYPTQ